MNILVTGGAGYIGSILSEDLIGQKHHVTVVDNFMYKQNSLAHLMHNKNLKVLNEDVRNLKQMNELYKKNEIIIPLAAIVGAPACQKYPMESTAINKNVIISMLENLTENQWVLMPTTNSAYGKSKLDEECDENSELNPLSLYAKDKVEVEKILLSYSNYTSFRLATVFGMSPRMRLDLLVNYFVKMAVNPGYVTLFESNFRRNYVHIKDVSRVFLYAIGNYNVFKNQIFNVGLSSANLTKLQLCKLIKREIESFLIHEAEFSSDPDQRDYLVSNKKLEETGFVPSFSIEQGIQELIKGIRTLELNPYTNL